MADPYVNVIMDPDLAQNLFPKEINRQKKLPKTSLCCKNMNEELFEKYKNLKTKSGWTIARAINTGVINDSSVTGCHAGDLETYHKFKDLFKPVIEQRHHGYDMDASLHITDMSVDGIKTDLSEAAKDKIVSTRIRVARNLAFLPLNTAGTKETRLEVADLMEKVFASLPGDLAGEFYRHSTMTPEQTRRLIDDHFLFRGKDKFQAASGYHEDWPHGRGIFVSKDKKFLSWINEGDHIRIISMEQGSDVKSVFSRLSRGVAAFEEGLKKIKGMDSVYSSDPHLGMITCCPTNLGTGMRGSVHARIPNLIKAIGFEKIDEIALTMNCEARGTTGEHSEVIDKVDISNRRRLGFKECDLVDDMIRCVNKLATLEDEAKSK